MKAKQNSLVAKLVKWHADQAKAIIGNKDGGVMMRKTPTSVVLMHSSNVSGEFVAFLGLIAPCAIACGAGVWAISERCCPFGDLEGLEDPVTKARAEAEAEKV